MASSCSSCTADAFSDSDSSSDGDEPEIEVVSDYSVPQLAVIKVLSNLHREDIVAKSSKGRFIITLADAFIASNSFK